MAALAGDVSFDVALRCADLIHSRTVVIFGKQGCIYCTKAKNMLSGFTKDLVYVDCSVEPHGKEILLCVSEMTHPRHSTIPLIFIGGKFQGGFSEVDSLRRLGRLAAMIEREERN